MVRRRRRWPPLAVRSRRSVEGSPPNLIDADDAVCGGGVGGANNLKDAANLNDAYGAVGGGAESRARNLYDAANLNDADGAVYSSGL